MKIIILESLLDIRSQFRHKYYKPDFSQLVDIIEGEEITYHLKEKYGEKNYSEFTKLYVIKLVSFSNIPSFYRDHILSVFGLLSGYEKEEHLIDRRIKLILEAGEYYHMEISLDNVGSVNTTCIRNENKAFSILQDWVNSYKKAHKTLSLLDKIEYEAEEEIELPTPWYLR